MRKTAVGVNTGSRSAAVSGRIPLLDTASRLRDYGCSFCIIANGQACALATYVDNFMSTRKSPEAGTRILDSCAEALAKNKVFTRNLRVYSLETEYLHFYFGTRAQR